MSVPFLLPLAAVAGAFFFMNRANASAGPAVPAKATPAAPKAAPALKPVAGRPFVFEHPDRAAAAGRTPGAGRTAARAFDAVVAAGGPLPSGTALTAKRPFLKGKEPVQMTLNDAFWLNHVDAHTPNQRVVGDDATRADYAEYLRRAYASV